MNKKNQEIIRKITAYHEAAHVVMALRFNVRVHEVALSPHAPGAGHMCHASLSTELDDIRKNPGSPVNFWRQVKRAAEKRIMILLAGALAEGKLFGSAMRTDGARSDLEEVVWLCEELVALRRHLNQFEPIPAVETRRLATRLRRKTRRLLGQPQTWLAVSTLADDLLQWRTLTGDDAADTVQHTRRPPGQLSLSLPLPVPAGAAVKPDANNSARHAMAARVAHQLNSLCYFSSILSFSPNSRSALRISSAFC